MKAAIIRLARTGFRVLEGLVTLSESWNYYWTQMMLFVVFSLKQACQMGKIGTQLTLASVATASQKATAPMLISSPAGFFSSLSVILPGSALTVATSGSIMGSARVVSRVRLEVVLVSRSFEAVSKSVRVTKNRLARTG